MYNNNNGSSMYISGNVSYNVKDREMTDDELLAALDAAESTMMTVTNNSVQSSITVINNKTSRK